MRRKQNPGSLLKEKQIFSRPAGRHKNRIRIIKRYIRTKSGVDCQHRVRHRRSGRWRVQGSSKTYSIQIQRWNNLDEIMHYAKKQTSHPMKTKDISLTRIPKGSEIKELVGRARSVSPQGPNRITYMD